MLLLRPLLERTHLTDRVVRLAVANPAPFYALAFAVSLELALLFSDARHFAIDAGRIGKALLPG